MFNSLGIQYPACANPGPVVWFQLEALSVSCMMTYLWVPDWVAVTSSEQPLLAAVSVQSLSMADEQDPSQEAGTFYSEHTP